ALAGIPFHEPALGSSITLDALDPRSDAADRYLDHMVMINPSDRYPTVENKLLSGLLRKTASGAQYMDPARLKEDLWWSFTFFELARGRGGDLPLASLGIPLTDGRRPTRKQILRFLDLAFKDDLGGKAIALRRLMAMERIPAPDGGPPRKPGQHPEPAL